MTPKWIAVLNRNDGGGGKTNMSLPDTRLARMKQVGFSPSPLGEGRDEGFVSHNLDHPDKPGNGKSK